MFPILLEIIAECSYPIDQATSLSFVYVSASIQGVFLMAIENILYRPLSEAELEKQTCADKEDTSHELAKDYLPYSVFVTVYMTAFVLLFTLFFQPEMKRSKADKLVLEKGRLANLNMSTATTESELLDNNGVNIDG